MLKPPIPSKLFVLMLVVVLIFIARKDPLQVFGSVTDSTPQSYLPVMLKISTPTHEAQPTANLTPTSENTPTATSTPTIENPPTATPTATSVVDQNWLTYLNWLRSLGNLPAITENTDWSYGDWLHARYMVKNDIIAHSEDSNNPWYTVEGSQAAASSDLMVSSSVNTTDNQAIDMWMSGPFHGVGIIDPALNQTAFGSYREAIGMYRMGAGLDVIRGLGAIPPSVTFPLRWPMDGSTMPYTRYNGNEMPDPLTSCSGYTSPSGPPIYLQIGTGNQVPTVTSFSLHQGGTNLAVCEFDETNYTNPDSGLQSLGRSVLNMRDAIILMPRNPLTQGLSYTVSITSNGSTYSWSFTVASSDLLNLPNAQIR